MTRTEIYAEELLMLLFYTLDQITPPTLGKVGWTYEGWLRRQGLHRRMRHLEQQKFLFREHRHDGWVYRLTRAGLDRVRGYRQPELLWNRDWDGWWRLILFDLPVEKRAERQALIRWLKGRGFGYLQDSVWISPDPVSELSRAVKAYRDQSASLSVLESRCAPGFSNAALVAGAWQFEDLTHRYDTYAAFAQATLSQLRNTSPTVATVFQLVRQESRLWKNAFDRDPLLPKVLWPRNYVGPAAWRQRRTLLTALATALNHTATPA